MVQEVLRKWGLCEGWHSMTFNELNSVMTFKSKRRLEGWSFYTRWYQSSNLRSCDSEHANLRHKILRRQIKSYGSNYWKNLLSWTLPCFNIPFSSWESKCPWLSLLNTHMYTHIQMNYCPRWKRDPMTSLSEWKCNSKTLSSVLLLSYFA